MSNEPESNTTTRRIWPWFALVGVVFAAVLAFLWVSAEVRRVKSIERFDYRPPATNAPAGR